MKIKKLVSDGIIVSPIKKEKLYLKENSLISNDGVEFALINNIPILIDNNKQKEYISENDFSMYNEYTDNKKKRKKNRIYKNFASKISIDSRKKIFPENEDNICISIGGGPTRIHEQFININIDLFENIDIVADAYALPFADLSVDKVYIGAVIEHLEFPDSAVSEIFRVLKPGGLVYSDIPFIQRFHGYPNHFQNYTLIGHKRLFERTGFHIIESGVCVGPTYAVLEIVNEYLLILFGKTLFGKGLRRLLFLSGKILRPIDKKLNLNQNAYTIASTTFVLAEK